MDFLKINGGYGEGGGQIIRTAVTLSCITKRPVHIENIRGNRKVPGLRPQHVTAIKILQEITDADVDGCRIGSTELKFSPKRIRDVTLHKDIGTAGSITLVLQAIVPLATVLETSLEIRIRGGTDVLWSPTAYYAQKVLREALKKIGIRFTLEIIKRGYFPKGEGEIRLEVFPSSAIPVSFSKRTSDRAKILCSFSKIPARKIREKVAQIEEALGKSFTTETVIREEEAVDSGSSLLVYCADENTAFGMDSLFDKKNMEFDLDVEKFTQGSFAIDENLADMLVVPASLASGKTIFEVEKITLHLETNLFVTSKMTGCRYGIGRLPGGYQIIIEGASDSSIKQGGKEQDRHR